MVDRVRIDRFQNVEIQQVGDFAARGTTRLSGRGLRLRVLDVDDDAVSHIVRIDFSVRNAGDLLVLSDAGPRVTAEGDRRRAQLNAHDARVRSHHECQRARGQGAGDARPQHAAPPSRCFTSQSLLACNHDAPP